MMHRSAIKIPSVMNESNVSFLLKRKVSFLIAKNKLSNLQCNDCCALTPIFYVINLTKYVSFL